MRYEPTERDPARRIHMHVVFILDILVVHFIRLHPIGRMPCTKEQDEFVLKVGRELRNGSARFGPDGEDFAQVRLGLDVCLEAVLVPALFFTYLAVPSESTEAYTVSAWTWRVYTMRQRQV
jgi:hypothetical protein